MDAALASPNSSVLCVLSQANEAALVIAAAAGRLDRVRSVVASGVNAGTPSGAGGVVQVRKLMFQGALLIPKTTPPLV